MSDKTLLMKVKKIIRVYTLPVGVLPRATNLNLYTDLIVKVRE